MNLSTFLSYLTLQPRKREQFAVEIVRRSVYIARALRIDHQNRAAIPFKHCKPLTLRVAAGPTRR